MFSIAPVIDRFDWASTSLSDSGTGGNTVSQLKPHLRAVRTSSAQVACPRELYF
jgi:hypothetical protein